MSEDAAGGSASGACGGTGMPLSHGLHAQWVIDRGCTVRLPRGWNRNAAVTHTVCVRCGRP